MAIDPISLAGWSLNRRFRRKTNPLALLDFPRVARQEFGFEAVELNNIFFESTKASYLRELRRRAEGEGVALLNITVDRCGDMASPREWRDAVKRHRPWLDAAAALGCPAIRANVGGHDAPSKLVGLAVARESFAALAAEGARRGVAVLIENHWGLSTDPAAIVAIVQAAGTPWLGTLPDFGNFPDEIRYDGLAQIAPYARAVHAKFYDFAPDGSHPRIDIARCVGILRAAGYRGSWGLEYEGSGDEHEGIIRSREMLRPLLDGSAA